jgi:beta-glucosidase
MKSRDPRFTPPSPAIEARVQALVDQLTLEEKITLLGGKPGPGSTFPVPRLGIPELRMADGPLGVHWWCEGATAYPAVIAAAASWDPELWYRLGSALGRDCRARGVHILLAPGVNIYRSALCGRNFEYAGEDPYLAGRFAVGYVSGLQDKGVAATIKHLACNFQEYDRHYVSSDVDRRTLHEVYLPAFKAAVVEAGSGALMTSYNLINDVHASEHPELLQEILKGEWGFQGLAMSDWVSVYSAVNAVNAGLDLEMPVAEYMNLQQLLPAIELGRVTEATIDDKVRRLLRLAACFGWLDHEQLDASIPHDDPETGKVALELARAGSVLLKNEGNFLPLEPKQLKTLAVVGFGADPAVFSGGGSAFTPPFRATSVLEGLKARLGKDVEILHARGPGSSPELGAFTTCRFGSPEGDGLWGEYFANETLEGNPVRSRLDPHIDFTWGRKPPIEGVNTRTYSVRWSGWMTPEKKGRHLFFFRSRNSQCRITIGGEVVLDTWAHENNGLHQIALELVAGHRYDVLIEWRKTRITGLVHFGWRADDGVVPGLDECVAVAKRADAAVICVGFDAITESEGYDRPFTLYSHLEKLVQAVAAAQPNSVVVLTAGGNVDMSGWIERVRGLLHVWYPGQAGGQAVAEILCGDVNPSGRLPATFEKRLEDRSSYNSYHDRDGDLRVELSDGVFGGYHHFDRHGIEPRFPFGFGLSYTTFAYGGLALSSRTLRGEQTLEVSLEVTNTGARAGAEVVQLYVRDVEARVPRPHKELKGFAKVELEPGEKKRVSIGIDRRALEFYDADARQWVAEPGAFELLIGASATDIRLEASFQLES